MAKRMIALAVTMILILGIFPIAPFADGAGAEEIARLPENTQKTVAETAAGTIAETAGETIGETAAETTAESELFPEEEEVPAETTAELLLEEELEAVTEQAQTVLTLENATFESLGYTPWDLSYDTEITETTAISSLKDLQALYDYVADGNSTVGHCYTFTTDITLPADWKPIGVLRDGETKTGNGKNILPFGGVINGNGHTLTVAEGGKSLLGYVRDAMVCNLNIYGKKIAGYGLVENYVVDYGPDGTNKDTDNTVTFFNVTLKSGTQTLQSGFIGGYASGYNEVYLMDCTVEAGVTIGYDRGQSHIGSFGGEFNGKMRNCTSKATVYGVDWVGGFAGNKGQSMASFEILDCTFDGSIEATGNYVGGIAGGGYAGTGWGMVTAPNAAGITIKNCVNTGRISGGNAVGGILGAEACVQQFWSNGIGYILNNSSTGTVKATKGSFVGGVIGFMQSLNKYVNISANQYQNAEKGIGAVGHVDTSGVEGGYYNGTFYYDTSKDDLGSINCKELRSYVELPTIGTASSGSNRAVTRKNHNRDDDPLGKDADKLCIKLEDDEPAAPVCYEIVVSGTYQKEYTVGDALNLSGIRLTAHWTDGTTTELKLSDVTVTGYDRNREGEQTVSISYGSAKAEIAVTVKPKSTKITVSVTILGDSEHGETSSPHGLARGGLITWASVSGMEAETSETVWDVLQRAAKTKGITFDADDNNKYGSVYIRAVNGLGEFDNGPNSGWMYTVNGTHPEVGVSARYVKNGDKIVLHYTDDYSYEEGGINYGKSGATSGSSNTANPTTQNSTVQTSEEQKQAVLKAMGNAGDCYTDTGDYMENLGTPSVGSIGGEWMVIGLARSGREVPGVEDYYQSVVDYVREHIDENQRLHKAKSTDNSRLILALTAIGKDVTNVDGHNLLLGLNDLDFVKKQGNNGPIWALLALDCGNYPEPEGNVTRQALVSEILGVQTSDGGWAISGDEADSDMTGMALQSLAPYYSTDSAVQKAVDKAIARLSQMQNDDGGFSTFSGSGGKVATSESASQVIVALAALGIDPHTDQRFVKNGHSAIDALQAYSVTGGGFRHVLDGQLDGMATEQAYYALTAYYRLLAGKTSLYDMTDIIDMGGVSKLLPAQTEPNSLVSAENGETSRHDEIWVLLLGLSTGILFGIVLGIGLSAVVVVMYVKMKKRFDK